jgi:hypothetical protein
MGTRPDGLVDTPAGPMHVTELRAVFRPEDGPQLAYTDGKTLYRLDTPQVGLGLELASSRDLALIKAVLDVGMAAVEHEITRRRTNIEEEPGV